MHHLSTCGMDVTMLLIVLMIHIIHVLCTIHMAHIVKWEQIVPMGHMDIWCIWDTCGTFGAYGVCGTCVMYVDEKCGTFVTHVPYLQMMHISMDLPNEYKHMFTSGSKNKIRSTPK
jgi:hypothetical protein